MTSSPKPVAAPLLATPPTLSMLLKQWMSKLIMMIVLWVVMSLVSAVMVGGLELPSWLSGRSTHEKDVGVQVLSNASAPSLADVGGMAEAKSEMWFNLVMPLRNPGIFFGNKKCFQTGHGILLFGAPGTGKTLLARAAARESGATFISPTLAQLEAKYYGETAKILEATFAVARKNAPSVIFFDEIDGMMRTRTSDEGCTYGLKTEMLRMFDSLEPHEAVIVVACTNSAAVLDPALKRRLNVVINIALPTMSERIAILNVCTPDDPISNSTLLTAVAEQTHDFSGSDIQNAYKLACSLRLRRLVGHNMDTVGQLLDKLPPLTTVDWTRAVERIRGDKVASNTQTVGGIGSASDALRDVLAGLKEKSPHLHQVAPSSGASTLDEEEAPPM